MKIQDIFNLAIEMGKQADFRTEKGLEKFLDRKKKQYEKLSEAQKQDFDKEALENPYLDSRILHIADDKEIKKVFIGVDIDPAELLIAKELGDIDLVISHHPLGKGLAHLSDVMSLQSDVLAQYGVPINVAEGLMRKRISEVARSVNSSNHQRTVDAAKLLGINLICLHTPCDNLAAKFLKDRIESKEIETVGELMDELRKIPEYKEAQKIGAGPKVFVGDEQNRTGKIAMTELTGGTEGSPKLYEKMATAGIGTVVGMHQSEEGNKEAEKANVNVVIAGHISSDSLGINILLDELEKKGIKAVPCSGVIRVSRQG
ncbi:MAG: NGG1p interacting factor NIF3 [Parcubacteria group bacterium]|nr:NGG1p interacting factor NIF3 [Parcubacteria group bacterium]